jgi:hypothetical protein
MRALERKGSQSSRTTGYNHPGVVRGSRGDGYRVVAPSGGRRREKSQILRLPRVRSLA